MFLHGDHRLVRRLRFKHGAQGIITAQMRHAAERRRADAADDRPSGVAPPLHAAQAVARRSSFADDYKAAQTLSGAILPPEQPVRGKAARAGEHDEQQIADEDHPARKVHYAEYEDQIDVQHHAERAAENDAAEFVDEAALRLRLVNAEQPEEHGVHRREQTRPQHMVPEAADRVFAPEQHEPDVKSRRHRRHGQRHIRCRPEDGLFCFSFTHCIFRRIGRFCQFLDVSPRGAVRSPRAYAIIILPQTVCFFHGFCYNSERKVCFGGRHVQSHTENSLCRLQQRAFAELSSAVSRRAALARLGCDRRGERQRRRAGGRRALSRRTVYEELCIAEKFPRRRAFGAGYPRESIRRDRDTHLARRVFHPPRRNARGQTAHPRRQHGARVSL